MPKKHIDALLRSKILVGLVLAVMMVLGIILVAQGFIDTRDYQNQIIQVIREKTGQDASIKGRVRISLVPFPTIYVPGIEIRGKDSAAPIPALTIEMLRINASVMSVFSDYPEISHVAVENPTLEIERTAQGVIHWDWLNMQLLDKFVGSRNAGSSVTFEISGGKVLFHSDRTDRSITAQNISASGSNADYFTGSGVFQIMGHDLQFSLNTQPREGIALPGTTPVSVRLFSDDKNHVALQGGLDLSAAALKIDGTVSGEMEDVLTWLRPKAAAQRQAFEEITNEATRSLEEKTLMPAKFTAQWNQADSRITLGNIQWSGLNSEGKGSIEVNGEKTLAIDTNVDFATFDYNLWRALFDKVFLEKPIPNTYPYRLTDDQTENPLPSDLSLNVRFAARDVFVAAQTWKNAVLSATLEDAAITVNQLGVELPGQSTLSLFGIISQGSTRGLRFEGSMETQGSSLRSLMTIFDESATNLPEAGLGNFYARSNVFVSSEQVRLSEADMKISELHLSGGLVAYYDANPRIEADVKLKDINFDYFRDAWRTKPKTSQDFFLKVDKNTNFNWLKKLGTNIDFKVSVVGFKFLDRKGNSASFRLFAKEGEFGIYNVRFYYPDETVEGNFTLDVQGEKPSVNVLLNTRLLDTSYFSAAPEENMTEIVPQADISLVDEKPVVPAKPAQTVEDLYEETAKPVDAASGKPNWSEELISMGWMEGINGVFDLSIGRLIHGDLILDRLKVRATLDNNLMTFRALSFVYWQGRCEITGTLYGGKVPGFSLGFTVFNAELQEILKSMVGRENISGKVSVSGTLSTSGVNLLSWVSQSEAKMMLAGRGIVVDGFNLQGAVDAVAVSVTASDVFNNVNRSLPKGSTDFTIDGTINIRGGVVRTPGITLKTGNIIGNLTGEVRLVPWTMQMSSFYQFPTMTSETIPTMTVQVGGPIPLPSMQVDTSSLEAYVAKRIVSH